MNNRIPFDIKYKPQIESGEYKVVIGYDWPIEILSWDCIHCNNKGNSYPILAKIRCMNPDGQDFIHWYNEEGKYDPWDGITLKEQDEVAYCPGHDLFLITPEPELTEFEKAVKDLCWRVGMGEVVHKDDIIKKTAAELLDLARKELAEELFASDATKTSLYKLGKAEALNEIEQDPESSYSFKRGVEYGKEEALKDLPRWRKWENGACGNGQGIPIAIVKRWLGGYTLVDALGITGEQYIMLSDLEKLPGFNE